MAEGSTDFWLAVAAAAPVILLSNAVTIGQSVGSASEALAAYRELDRKRFAQALEPWVQRRRAGDGSSRTILGTMRAVWKAGGLAYRSFMWAYVWSLLGFFGSGIALVLALYALLHPGGSTATGTAMFLMVGTLVVLFSKSLPSCWATRRSGRCRGLSRERERKAAARSGHRKLTHNASRDR